MRARADRAAPVAARPTALAGLVEAKIRPPRLREDVVVVRTRIIRRVAELRDARVISIAAPAGYGKTTLLAHWARTERRPVAWVTIDAADNDVVSLFTYLAAAIDRVAPLEHGVGRMLGSPGLPPSAIARQLLSTLPSGGSEVLVVLDDIHRLTDDSCLDALRELIEGLPEGWQIAIAGRSQMNPYIARWRAERSLFEIGVHDLVLDEAECAALGRSLGFEQSREDVSLLVRRFEGWPAGLYLAILAMKRSGSERPSLMAAGDESYIADYLQSEVLTEFDPDMLTLLSRTAFLDRLSGPLCDAVVGGRGSASKLEALAKENSLIIRLGQGRGWYRYHTLLREYLWSEVKRNDPALIPELHRRAGIWYEEHGLVEDAIVELLAAGEDERAARLLGSVALDLHYSGRAGTLRDLGARFDEPRLQRHAWLATLLAWPALLSGDSARVERLVNVIDRASFAGTPPDGTASFESGRAMLNVMLGRDGTDGMRTNADLAVAFEPTWSPWRAVALQASAIASMASGDHDRAEREFAETIDVASAASASEEEQGALALSAFLAIGRGDWGGAGALTDRSAEIMHASHLETYWTSVLTYAASARVSLQRGDVSTARACLASAQLLRPLLTHWVPWISVRALLELARAYLAMSETEGVRAMIGQAEDILRKRPNIGPVAAEVRDLREQIRALPVAFTGSSGLTASELRVLAFLPFHLSYREIADRLGVRESTVKTHTASIYGKFGVSTRGSAVEMAAAVGLVAGVPS